MMRKINIAIVILLLASIFNSPLYASSSTLTWSPVAGDVDGYIIYYGTSEGDYPYSQDVSNVSQYSLDTLNLSEGKTYYFTVRAYNSNGESSNSNVTSYTVPTSGDLTPPLPPQNVAANMVNAVIALTWQASKESDIQEYQLYTGTTSRSYGLPISVGNVSGYQYTDFGSGISHYFAVTAVDNSGNESGYSNEAVVTSQTVPVESGALTISNLKAASGYSYKVVEDLKAGALSYIDRTYTYPTIPAFLLGAQYIKTRNDDMRVSGSTSFLTFDVNMDVMVYVAHDDRTPVKPSWMNGFTDTGSDLKTWSAMSLFGKKFPAGKVVLGSNDSTGSMYTVVVVPAERELPPVADTVMTISNLKAASGYSYKVVEDLKAGALSYIDRTYTYPTIPAFLLGAQYIKTRNDDMRVSGSTSFLTFDVNMDVMVYVAHDDRTPVKPSWMNGFTDTGSDLKTWSAMSLFGKKFPAGKVVLGSNDSTGSMYTVVVVPAERELPPVADPVMTISNLKAASGYSYKVVEDLKAGALSYIDRTYTYPTIPAFLLGAQYIKTRNDDMRVSGSTSFLTFDVNMDVMVYVAHDDRTPVKPSWMNGFTDTGSDLKTWSAMSLFGKKFPAGKVVLGSNDSTGSMYTVVVTPL